MVQVIVRGFKTVEQAKHWADWYEGQGEQDWSIWYDCRKDEGKDVHPAMTKTVTIEGENVIINV